MSIQTVYLDANYLLIAGNPRQSNLKCFIQMNIYRMNVGFEIDDDDDRADNADDNNDDDDNENSYDDFNSSQDIDYITDIHQR